MGENGKIATFLQLLYSDATALTIKDIKAIKIGRVNRNSVAMETEPNIRFSGKNPNISYPDGRVAYEIEARHPQNFLQSLFQKEPQKVGSADIIIKKNETLTPQALIDKFLAAMKEAAGKL